MNKDSDVIIGLVALWVFIAALGVHHLMFG